MQIQSDKKIAGNAGFLLHGKLAAVILLAWKLPHNPRGTKP
jgi:hypothetical protein